MEVKINGEVKSVEAAGLTITKLLEQEQVANPEMVSVQVNGDFLNREDYASTLVKENDEIDFLYFMGGGSL